MLGDMERIWSEKIKALMDVFSAGHDVRALQVF